MAASSTTYFWLIVFEWNHTTQTPFSVHVINPTFLNIVPEQWIIGKLQEENRRLKMKMKTLNKTSLYSVFAKIAKGRGISAYVS